MIPSSGTRLAAKCRRIALVVAASLGVAAAVPLSAEQRAPALRLGDGSVARNRLVAVGRDLRIEGTALSDVAALDGSVEITGRVDGDVIVLGGSAHLRESSEVRGQVYVLGGEIETAPGARIGGHAVAYPSMSRAWLTLLEGPAIGLPATSRVVVAGKLALAAAWLFLLLVLFATSGRALLATSEEIRRQPFRQFAVGLVGVLSLTLTALLLSTVAAALVGLPLLGLVVILALLLKLWGMVAVFHALGSYLLARAQRRRVLALHAAVAGFAFLALLKFVPYLGLWVWTVASFVAVGAALSSKFGRREPWFSEQSATSFA
ncbi:MAG: polymer-forming cytoskeletal protein [Holophagales bacterium]|nr:MAG: polymer-forming cytoskeletal protein [Holophagales bacterium]